MLSRTSFTWLLLLLAAALAAFRTETLASNPSFADSALPTNRSATLTPLPSTPELSSVTANGQPHIVSRRNGTDMVHSASVAELDDGRLFATWFGGSREGAKDVAIYGAYFDLAKQEWSAATPLITRESTQQALGRYIKKLGNPVVTRLDQGQLAIFYVSVSVGGWATSQVNMVLSDDNGASWHSTQRLVTSPFFNLSTLVKGTPYLYQDGTIALPVYHEMAGKFGEILRLTADGQVLSKTRLTEGREAIQPVLLPYNEHDAIALMRDTGDEAPFTAVMAKSDSSGHDWSAAENTSVANPNSALAGVVLDCGRILSVANDTSDERNRLTLLISNDKGASWHPILRVEDDSKNGTAPRRVPQAEFISALQQSMTAEGLDVDQQARFLDSATDALCTSGGCRYRYDYPYLIKGSDGTIHLVYTWNKAYIKHRAFSQEWLSQWI
ncbi:MAG: hypothetical protein CMN85_15460 [Spongiibacteraceae bacterium]|nr:hypothetical protein [Spongiibacteraceae bacterium]